MLPTTLTIEEVTDSPLAKVIAVVNKKLFA